jgi:hypothetical protein
VDILPAGPALVARAGAIAGDAVADAVDAAELLDVDMDEFARRVALIADDGGLGIERGKAAEPRPAQHEADSGNRPAQPPGYGRTGQTLTAKCHDLIRLRITQPVGAAMRARRAIRQAGRALRA